MIEENTIKLWMQNAQGYPSSRGNGHKMIDYVNKIDKFHAMIILETGVNKNEKLRDIADDVNITVTNPMKDIDREQYQHNGNGTAILTHKNIEF